MNSKWPTLEGRLSQPLTSTEDALLQMKANGDTLSPLAQKILGGYKRCREEIKPFHKQLCECNDFGFRKETVFESFEEHPEWLPAMPGEKEIKTTDGCN